MSTAIKASKESRGRGRDRDWRKGERAKDQLEAVGRRRDRRVHFLRQCSSRLYSGAIGVGTVRCDTRSSGPTTLRFPSPHPPERPPRNSVNTEICQRCWARRCVTQLSSLLDWWPAIAFLQSREPGSPCRFGEPNHRFYSRVIPITFLILRMQKLVRRR